MNDNVAIRVENVSKKYCKSLKTGMVYGVEDIVKNVFGMSAKPERLRKQEFWALDNISFEVEKGEAIGLIGRNGAGKTTMLQLLNGIFWPDKGSICMRGRVGALIAVGAGFHPQLTGRENISVNAAILGMTRKEVEKKFDEIVEFADIGDFLDTPVKHYSSGMFVRLGFAVAIHCEPEVLLVDEILAVGDVAFQRKCFDRMEKVRNNGTTIVLVTHSMKQVERLCNKAVFFKNSKVLSFGNPTDVISDYFKDVNVSARKDEKFDEITEIPQIIDSPMINLLAVRLLDIKGNLTKEFECWDSIVMEIDYTCEEPITESILGMGILTSDMNYTSIMTSENTAPSMDLGVKGTIRCILKNVSLIGSEFFIDVKLQHVRGGVLAQAQRIISFQMNPPVGRKISANQGVVMTDSEWDIIK